MQQLEQTHPDHWDLSASGAERWLNCKRSPYLIKAAPKEIPNIHAAKGTVAHKVAATMLMEAFDRFSELKDPWNHSLTQTQEGFEIEVDDQMLDGIAVYIEHVRGIVEQYQLPPTAWGVETEGLLVPGVMTPLGPVGGTPDHWAFVESHGLLIVSDYKNGYNEVDVNDNPQLLTYLVAKFAALTPEQQSKITRVVLYVVQPNGSGQKVKTISYTVPELAAFYHKLSTGALEVTPDAPVVAGKWCKYCPAQVGCKTWEAYWRNQASVDFGGLTLEQRATAAAMQDQLKQGAPSVNGETAGAALPAVVHRVGASRVVGTLLPLDPKVTGKLMADALSPEQLTNTFRLKGLMNNYFDAVEARIKVGMELTPEQFPDFSLESSLGNRQFVDEALTMSELEYLLEDMFNPRKLKSPNQMELTVKKLPNKTQEDKEIRLALLAKINNLTTRKMTAPTLKYTPGGQQIVSGAAADFQGLNAPQVVDALSVKEVQ